MAHTKTKHKKKYNYGLGKSTIGSINAGKASSGPLEEHHALGLDVERETGHKKHKKRK